MFAPTRNITVNASTRSLLQYPAARKDEGVVVTAYAGGGSGTSGGSFQQNIVSSNATVPLLEGIMSNDKAARHKLFKDMYYHDPVSGGAVDVLSSFLGDFHLSGISDPARMDKYSATASSISPATLFPLITTEYLVHGHFIGTKIFDKSKGYITGITPHDVASVNITPVNVHGAQPIFDLSIDEDFRNLLKSSDQRVRDIINMLPKFYQNAAADGRIPLTPQNTIFFPRQRLADMSDGVSLFERTLPVYLIEKNLLRGTIDASNRRQRAILHAMVSGDDEWMPDPQYLQQVNDRIKAADMDPQGAVMTTGDNIRITQFMEPHSFWSIDQISAWASEMKFYAYRISPSMINGTSSLSTLDASLSIMVNDLRQYRSLFENKIMKESIFGDVAIANGFKDEDSHRNDSLSVEKRFGRQTFNLAEYELPHVVWKQSLSPEGDSAYLNMLQEISHMGVPVNLSMYAAAAGLNLDDLLDGAEKDVDDRKRASKYWRDIMRSSNSLVEQQVQSEFALKQQKKEARMAYNEEMREQGVNEVTASLAAYNSRNYNGVGKVPWDKREWDTDKQGFENTDNDGNYRIGTKQGRDMRRDTILKHVAERVAEEKRKEAYLAKEAEWQRNHS